MNHWNKICEICTKLVHIYIYRHIVHEVFFEFMLRANKGHICEADMHLDILIPQSGILTCYVVVSRNRINRKCNSGMYITI
jgi:hypothetical protein